MCGMPAVCFTMDGRAASLSRSERPCLCLLFGVVVYCGTHATIKRLHYSSEMFFERRGSLTENRPKFAILFLDEFLLFWVPN